MNTFLAWLILLGYAFCLDAPTVTTVTQFVYKKYFQAKLTYEAENPEKNNISAPDPFRKIKKS
jgi:hypothetical protein